MIENIINENPRHNTQKPIFFTSNIDAGFYGSKDKGPKVGAISVSVQLDMESFKRYAEKIINFGFFIFADIEDDTENILYDNERRLFINKNGTFNIVISEISEKNFSDTISIIPFILIDTRMGEKRLFGDTIKVGVYEDKVRTQENLRWLGEKL